MPTTEQLIQKIQQLEDQLAQQTEKVDALMTEAQTAVNYASHTYRVDHYGYIWVWDTETSDYKKTKMRICTPEIADMSLESRHIQDNAIEGRHINDDVIEGRMIKNKTIDGRSLKDDIIGPELIQDLSIPGDSYTPNGIIPGKLANDAVQTRNIKDRNVTSSKIGLNAILPEHVSKQTFRELSKDLQNQIDALQIHGLAVSNEFGSDTHIGISQKTLTEAINKLWQKIEDITGEVLQGLNMVVTPEYYIGETGADVHITANTVDTNGIFEHIAFYGNGALIAEADNVDFFEHDFHIDETTVVQCVAKIMGVEYNRQGIITHYSSFLLGSGYTYADLMDGNNRFLPQYVIPITNGMRGAYNVNVAEGKRIIIVVGDSLSEGFIRADLNGAEIQFTESTCTDADGKVYKVFTSDTWSAGDYNIDING